MYISPIIDINLRLLDSMPISEIENNTTNDINAATVIQSEETDRIQRNTCCFHIYATVTGIQIADAKRKMRQMTVNNLNSSVFVELGLDLSKTTNINTR